MAARKTQSSTKAAPKPAPVEEPQEVKEEDLDVLEETEDEEDDDVEMQARGVARRKGVKTKAERRREFANWCANNKYASEAQIREALKTIVGA